MIATGNANRNIVPIINNWAIVSVVCNVKTRISSRDGTLQIIPEKYVLEASVFRRKMVYNPNARAYNKDIFKLNPIIGLIDKRVKTKTISGTNINSEVFLLLGWVVGLSVIFPAAVFKRTLFLMYGKIVT